MDEHIVPLMGVMGAFVFAAQMINFSIPGTGSSGHLGGGMMLAILLGSQAGFLVITSVLIVQALFFADGGLLALGCNIFNMGFFPCFIAYPWIYKKIAGNRPSQSKLFTAATISSIAALQMGAFCVVIETTLSGISALPFITFTALMQPIHLAIGIVEGFVTSSVIIYVWKARPEIIQRPTASDISASSPSPIRTITLTLLTIAALTAGVASWFASSHPDGLEWAMFKTSNTEELDTPQSRPYEAMKKIQAATAFMPDYGFKSKKTESDAIQETEAQSIVDPGTSIAGLVGGLMTMLIAAGLGLVLKKKVRKQ